MCFGCTDAYVRRGAKFHQYAPTVEGQQATIGEGIAVQRSARVELHVQPLTERPTAPFAGASAVVAEQCWQQAALVYRVAAGHDHCDPGHALEHTASGHPGTRL
ncbi:hypothetical protein D3C76_1346070 [compost metagenome]